MLRQHSYMKYSNDQAAWNQRVHSASEAFITLVRKKTGIHVIANLDAIPIDEIRHPGREDARRLATRVSRKYHRAADSHAKDSKEYAGLMKISELWIEAAKRI